MPWSRAAVRSRPMTMTDLAVIVAIFALYLSGLGFMLRPSPATVQSFGNGGHTAAVVLGLIAPFPAILAWICSSFLAPSRWSWFSWGILIAYVASVAAYIVCLVALFDLFPGAAAMLALAGMALAVYLATWN